MRKEKFYGQLKYLLFGKVDKLTSKEKVKYLEHKKELRATPQQYRPKFLTGLQIKTLVDKVNKQNNEKVL